MAYIKPTQTQGWGNNNNSYQQQQTATAPIQPPQQEEKGQTIEITAIFKGIMPSINKQGQLMEGTDKNGKQWKAYDVIFMKQGAQQNKVFRVFNDLSGKSLRLNQLVAGTEYKLLYEQGIQQVKANKLFFIGIPQKSVQQQPLAQAPMYAPPNQKTLENSPQNQPQIPPKTILIAPEHEQLWNDNNFSSKEEWMWIAYDSGIFNSEEEAENVWKALSGE